MRFNPRLKKDIEKYFNYVIIVEGKKDVLSLKSLGFKKVFEIHSVGVPIRERVLQIIKEIDKKDNICILTDFDKKGKKMYMLLKQLFQEQGSRLEVSLRGLILKSGISHIEGMSEFMGKIKGIS